MRVIRSWVGACLVALLVPGSAATAEHEVALSDQVHDPRWSPSGKQLAYVVTHGYVESHGFANPRWRARVWLVDADGRHAQALTPRQFNVENLAWSPDGAAIAYAAGGHLWRADLKGHVTQLTFGGADDSWWPAWSPDGTKIAYTRGHRFEEGIYWIPASGGTPTEVTKTHERPQWSPDGTFLFVQRTPAFVNLDGSPHPAPSDDFWTRAAAYSPDKKVTALTNGFNGRVYLRTQAGKVTPLPDSDSVSERPAWSTTGVLAFIARGQCGRHSEVRVTDENGLRVRTLARAC